MKKRPVTGAHIIVRFVCFYMLCQVIKLDVAARGSNLSVIVVLHMIGSQSGVLISQINVSIRVSDSAHFTLLFRLKSCDLIAICHGL